MRYGFVLAGGDIWTIPEMADECLEILKGARSGEEFSHDGERYQVQSMKLLPPSVQQPRIPVWVDGMSEHNGFHGFI